MTKQSYNVSKLILSQCILPIREYPHQAINDWSGAKEAEGYDSWEVVRAVIPRNVVDQDDDEDAQEQKGKNQQPQQSQFAAVIDPAINVQN